MIKILAVDDEPGIIDGIELALLDEIESGQYQILKACDGIEGWVQIKLHTPDILLLDINMPEMSGIELLNKIILNKVDTEVIIISSYNTVDNLHATLDGNKAYKFLVKKFSNKLLKETILEVLENRKEERNGLVAAKKIVNNLSITQKYSLIEKILPQLPNKYLNQIKSKLPKLESSTSSEEKLDFEQLEYLDTEREKEGKITIKLLNKSSIDIANNKYLLLRWRNNEGKLEHRYFKSEDFQDPITTEIVKEKLRSRKKPVTPNLLKNIADYYQINDLAQL